MRAAGCTINDIWDKDIDKKISRTKNINLANSRNIGLEHCHGNLILLTDDDARPYPDWIEKIKKYHLKYPNSGLIGGDVISECNGSFLSKIADATTFPRYKSIRNVRSLPGVNSSFKMEVIKMVGKYDISLTRGEDVDFNWRVLETGWNITYVPNIKVKHFHRDSWLELCYQHYMYGRSYYLIRDKWKKMYSVYPHNLNSFKKIVKYISSWTYTPMMDAYIKSKNFTNMKLLVIIMILKPILLKYKHASKTPSINSKSATLKRYLTSLFITPSRSKKIVLLGIKLGEYNLLD